MTTRMLKLPTNAIWLLTNCGLLKAISVFTLMTSAHSDAVCSQAKDGMTRYRRTEHIKKTASHNDETRKSVRTTEFSRLKLLK